MTWMETCPLTSAMPFSVDSVAPIKAGAAGCWAPTVVAMKTATASTS